MDTRSGRFLRFLVVIVVIEKIMQHCLVTLAFAFNWGDIAATVAVDPVILMVLGAPVALLFGVGLWAFLTHRHWATTLLAALAVFDVVGEFVAQGRLAITITVSFLVALLLLLLLGVYRRRVGPG